MPCVYFESASCNKKEHRILSGTRWFLILSRMDFDRKHERKLLNCLNISHVGLLNHPVGIVIPIYEYFVVSSQIGENPHRKY